MPRKKKPKHKFNLPRGVHPVIGRGKVYFYYQTRRNTPQAGPRIKLPDDPHSPEFWTALRQAQGITGQVETDTVNALIDAFIAAFPTPLKHKLSASTQAQYKRWLKLAGNAWGELKADGLRPLHVQTLMDSMNDTPGKANAFLGAMRALSKFARLRDLVTSSFIEGVGAYDTSGKGHKPWTDEQIQVAREKLTGLVRRGFFLAWGTGQRGSDVVRLGPTHIEHTPDGDGFRLAQKKTGVEPWCPIIPELAAEMETWERRPGPFVLQESGKPITWKHFWKFFNAARDTIPELKGTTPHGLRANAVIRMREQGFTTSQIVDTIGLSRAMVERYSRFADKKRSGRAVLIELKVRAKERPKNKTVKR